MYELSRSFKNATVLDDVKDVAYRQYLDNPTGPYVFCWDHSPITPGGDVMAMNLAIHPYLDDLPLGTLLNGTDAAYAEEKKRMLIDNAKKAFGTWFNYTEHINQAKMEEADAAGPDVMVTFGEDIRKILGFIIPNPADVTNIVNCGCRYTGVPIEARRDENTRSAVSGVSGAMAVMLSLFVLIGSVIVLL